MKAYDADAIQLRLEKDVARRLGCRPEDIPGDYRKILKVTSWNLAFLHSELDSSNDRILSSFFRRALTPVLGRPRPAWAIGYSRPSSQSLGSRHIFQTEQGLYFSPAFHTKLANVTVGRRVAGGEVRGVSYPSQPEEVLLTGVNRMPANTIWLGIRVKGETPNSMEIPFFVDWPGAAPERKKALSRMLPYIQWESNGATLPVVPGYQPDGRNALPEFPDEEYFVRQSIEEEVLQHCQGQFLTVRPTHELVPRNYPVKLAEYFSEDKLVGHFSEPMIWFELRFPEGVTPEEVASVRLTPNAFPVLNRRLQTQKDRIAESEFEVIKLTDHDPLAPGSWGAEQFLCMKSVWSEEQKTAYRPVAFSTFDLERTPTGSYALQYGQVEAWERGDARRKVEFLLQEIKQQTSGFSTSDREAIGRPLIELEKSIGNLEGQLKNYTSIVNYYLHIRTRQPREHLFIEYWLTQGKRVNHRILPMTWLVGEGPAQENRLLLLTEPQDGRDPLSEAEQVVAFKEALTPKI